MAKAKPERSTNEKYTLYGLIGVVAWFIVNFCVPHFPDFFYGRYGALLLGGLVAIIARAKRRNTLAWFAVGIWTVLAGLIIILVLPKLYDRLCPYCLEGVAGDATVCPHCRKELEAQREVVLPSSGLPEKTGRLVWKIFLWVMIILSSLAALILIAAIVLRVLRNTGKF